MVNAILFVMFLIVILIVGGVTTYNRVLQTRCIDAGYDEFISYDVGCANVTDAQRVARGQVEAGGMNG